MQYDEYIDYTKIGLKIREYRKKRSMTQDDLAEATSFSNTHISNIETGNTKLSLPALVKVANVLQVTVDKLLLDNYTQTPSRINEEFNNIIEDCVGKDVDMILEMTKHLKKSLLKYNNENSRYKR